MTTESLETLESYLAGDYHEDMDDIRELEKTLVAVQNVFIHSIDDGRWPYERRSRPTVRPPSRGRPNVSHGTQAMIAAALGKMTGQCTLASGMKARLDLKANGPLGVAQRAGTECLLKSIGAGPLISGTFGTDDPVTLSHVTELIRGLQTTGQVATAEALATAIRTAIDLLAKLADENPALSRDLLPNLPLFGSELIAPRPGNAGTPPKKRQPDYVINAFVPLRIVRSINNLMLAGYSPNHSSGKSLTLTSSILDPFRRYFESTVYDQLSFSAIPDSRFDAAEMIFCLEGLMLCGRHVLDDRLFEHALKVLQQKQELSAQWRPNRPVFATPQGMTMLPVSVEGAVSLVRSIEMMDRQRNYQGFSTLGIPLARRFWHWLRARKVEFPAAEPSTPTTAAFSHLTGWHSEHVNDPGVMHLWDTSQVIEFMLSYREMLQRSIAGRSLLLSRLKIDLPARERPLDWLERWEADARTFEPRSGTATKIYTDRLTEDFVKPWGRGEPRHYSILLYGPPGTGKSSFAENLAKALGMRMITVTVSDFLGRGGANVEARAKAIFQTLEAQFDSVILFDEIDSFLLDRDSERYGQQDSVFQFLTPGMLTKINDLRKRKRSIFIMATNYANRIDPAIKRRGRIDQHYLLQLPDAPKRIAIIEGLRRGRTVALDKIDALKEGTLFFGFSDLKILVEDAEDKGGTDQALLDLIATGQYDPITSLAGYVRRYPEHSFPFDELLELAELEKEVRPSFGPSDITITHGDRALRKKFEDELKEAVSQRGSRGGLAGGTGRKAARPRKATNANRRQRKGNRPHGRDENA